jgi:hypothetical protein
MTTTKFLRRAAVAERYSVDERTVERMRKDGRLPQPHYRGRFPLWSLEELEASDRAAVIASRRAAEREKVGSVAG